jgi:hypothetical protein
MPNRPEETGFGWKGWPEHSNDPARDPRILLRFAEQNASREDPCRHTRLDHLPNGSGLESGCLVG